MIIEFKHFINVGKALKLGVEEKVVPLTCKYILILNIKLIFGNTSYIFYSLTEDIEWFVGRN